MELGAGVSCEHPEPVSSLGTRDPCKSPESSTSLCSPEQFPHGLNFSFKSPFPVLLTSLRGRKVALAGSNSTPAAGSQAWPVCQQLGAIPEAWGPVHAVRLVPPPRRRGTASQRSCHAEGNSRPPRSGGCLLCHSLRRQQAQL